MQLSHSLPVFSTCLTPLMIFGLRGLKSQLNLVRVFHFKVFCYAPVTAIYNYVCSCILYTINHFFVLFAQLCLTCRKLLLILININIITSKDEGTYSCYCYYNRTMVITSKYVISNEMSATIHLGKGM